MDHQVEEDIEEDVPDSESYEERRDRLPQVAAYGESDSGEHQHGGRLSAELDDKPSEVVRTRCLQFFDRYQREEIVWRTVRVQAMTERIVNVAQVDDDCRLDVAEGNTKEDQGSHDAVHILKI